MRSKKRKLLAVVLAVVLILVGLFFYMKGRPDDSKYPVYLNFSGRYVFSVPKEYSVDEQSVPGVQIVYSGTFTVSTLEDVYNVGGISLREITDLTDRSDKAFKKYVEEKFVPQLKKDLSTDDIEVKFDKESGSDLAKITAKKDGKVYRVVYIKNGEHPALLVSKTESKTLVEITKSLRDVEKTSLKDEIEPVKSSTKTTVQQVKDQSIDELYDAAAPELRSSSTKEQVVKAIQDAGEFIKGNIVIAGGSYDGKQEFSAVIRFIKPGEDQKAAFGQIILTKQDGKWKLKGLNLPAEQAEQPADQ